MISIYLLLDFCKMRTVWKRSGVVIPCLRNQFFR